MAIYGEKINQHAPSVVITGSTSGTITFNPATFYSGETTLLNGTSGNWRRVDHGRILTHELTSTAALKSPKQLPVIVGTAVITITAAAGTQVHYRIGPKNPTSKGITQDGTVNTGGASEARSQSYVYSGAITLDAARPGNTVTTLRLRAYKTANQEIRGATVSGISPNEKSEVIILKFVHKAPL